MRLGEKVYCEHCRKLIRDYMEYEVLGMSIPPGRVPRYCDDECKRNRKLQQMQEYRWRKKREREEWDKIAGPVGGLTRDDILYAPFPIRGLTKEDVLQM